MGAEPVGPGINTQPIFTPTGYTKGSALDSSGHGSQHGLYLDDGGEEPEDGRGSVDACRGRETPV